MISKSDIVTLRELSTSKDLVPVDTIPDSLRKEFQAYFFGKTLVRENKTVFAYPHDVKRWIRFILNKYNE